MKIRKLLGRFGHRPAETPSDRPGIDFCMIDGEEPCVIPNSCECLKGVEAAQYISRLSSAAHLCVECGQPQEGPHRGTCSYSLAMGGPGYGALGGEPYEPSYPDAASFDEVLRIVARGRMDAFATGSPVQFWTRDGVLCTITFNPALPPSKLPRK